MKIKEVCERIKKAKSILISISDENWELFDDTARVVDISGPSDDVRVAATALIKNGELVDARTVAIVFFCNPKDSLRVMGAVPAEEIAATGARILYCVCFASLESGNVEMYIISD